MIFIETYNVEASIFTITNFYRSVISFLEQILLNTIITTNSTIITANEKRD